MPLVLGYLLALRPAVSTFLGKIINYSSKLIGLMSSIFAYVMCVKVSSLIGPPHNGFQIVFLRFAEAYVAFCLLAFLLNNPSSLFTKIFENPIPVFIGKISYGVYVFHHLLYNPFHHDSSLASKVLLYFPAAQASDPLKFLILTSITFALATFSWFFYERYFLTLKEKFHYSKGEL
jgi:peptidoglycan/LPS O-acetylase OafA/YrhL